MKCLIFAYSEIGVECIETLVDLGETIVGVVTHKDNPNENRWFRSVEEESLNRGIPVITPEDPNTDEVLAWAKAREPDILFSFYYRKMLKEPLLRVAPKGAYNLHGSLLPKFRGRAPVNWAIIEGATETGLTLHEMVKRADAGDILAQEAVPITETETARELFDKLVPVARRLMTTIVPLLRDGTAPRTRQNESQATYFGARTPEDGRLDWTWSARRVHNMVRALTRPYPGAFTSWKGRKLFVWKGIPAERTSQRTPGEVLGKRPEGALIATGDGNFLVKEVQWDGGSLQNAADVLHPGMILDGK